MNDQWTENCNEMRDQIIWKLNWNENQIKIEMKIKIKMKDGLTEKKLNEKSINWKLKGKSNET